MEDDVVNRICVYEAEGERDYERELGLRPTIVSSRIGPVFLD